MLNPRTIIYNTEVHCNIHNVGICGKLVFVILVSLVAEPWFATIGAQQPLGILHAYVVNTTPKYANNCKKNSVFTNIAFVIRHALFVITKFFFVLTKVFCVITKFFL